MTQSSPTKQATWYLLYTAMLHTSANQKHKVEQEAFFLCHPTPRTPKQRCCFEYCSANQICHAFGGRSQTWRILHERTQGHPATPTSGKKRHTQLPTPMQTDNSTANSVIIGPTKKYIQPSVLNNPSALFLGLLTLLIRALLPSQIARTIETLYCKCMSFSAHF
jgi:hypothetical protein